MEHVYLSRRNLLTLLSKLDRKAKGDPTQCTLSKFRNDGDPFVQTMDAVLITAVEDKDFYTTRPAGIVHPKDDPDA